jgi:transcriptional regulator with XRE-family HTH domain
MTNDLIGWIEQERERRNWSINELARQAGLSPGTVADVLNQRTNPGLQFCTEIARALNVPPENILRLAGLLPPQPEETATINEFIHLLNQLPAEEQKELLLVAKAWVEGRERQRGIKAR